MHVSRLKLSIQTLKNGMTRSLFSTGPIIKLNVSADGIKLFYLRNLRCMNNARERMGIILSAKFEAIFLASYYIKTFKSHPSSFHFYLLDRALASTFMLHTYLVLT